MTPEDEQKTIDRVRSYGLDCWILDDQLDDCLAPWVLIAVRDGLRRLFGTTGGFDDWAATPAQVARWIRRGTSFDKHYSLFEWMGDGEALCILPSRSCVGLFNSNFEHWGHRTNSFCRSFEEQAFQRACQRALSAP